MESVNEGNKAILVSQYGFFYGAVFCLSFFPNLVIESSHVNNIMCLAMFYKISNKSAVATVQLQPFLNIPMEVLLFLMCCKPYASFANNT